MSTTTVLTSSVYTRHLHNAARFLILGAALGVIWQVDVRSAFAQDAATPSAAPLAPTALAAPPLAPATSSINVLLLPIDELPAVAAQNAAPQPVAPRTAPIAPTEQPQGEPPGAITPASLREIPFPIQWRALAQRNDRDDRFLPTPDFGGPRPLPEPPSTATPPGRIFPTAPNAGPMLVAPAPEPAAVAPNEALAPPQPTPPGRTQLAAVPLRAALGERGFGDVLGVAIDSPTITRVLGEGRLTPLVVQSLKTALAELNVTPNDAAALQIGVQSATRIGQAVGFRAVVPFYVSTPRARPEGGLSATFVMLLADANRETGRAFVFDETGADERELRAAGAGTSAILLERALREWTPVSAVESVALAGQHLENARAAVAANNSQAAQDEINQVLALDPNRAEAYVLLGDALARLDPAASARAYRRAVELNARDGETWAKITQAYANATPPDYANALEAGRKALAAGADTVTLHIALASTRFGRAELYRKSDRLERAEDDEFHARQHLERALQLAPDDPSVIRLLARSLLTQNRIDDAVSTLDRLAPRFLKDLEIQALYANALARKAGREEDAFLAAARVWKLTGQTVVESDAASYRTLAGGFDVRVFSIGRSAVQLTTGVANAAVPRESAFLQLSKFREEMAEAETAINTLRAPASVPAEAAAARIFAADLTNQALEALQTYLETGQEIYRSRGLTLYRQAVFSLNQARTAQ